jgi:hypothetical protein
MVLLLQARADAQKKTDPASEQQRPDVLARLRKAAARTVDDLWETIAQAIDAFTPQECQNFFAAAGYDQE